MRRKLADMTIFSLIKCYRLVSRTIIHMSQPLQTTGATADIDQGLVRPASRPPGTYRVSFRSGASLALGCQYHTACTTMTQLLLFAPHICSWTHEERIVVL